MKYSVSIGMILFLASIFAIGPFAVDAYIPALPAIAADIGSTTSAVALTVSLFAFTNAFGQLIGGPASDKLGRRNVIVAGMLLFIVGSLALSRAESINALYFWRVVQALGAGIAGVCAPAIIRDVAEGKEAAKLFTLIGLIMMIAPSIAPSIGTIIIKVADWRWVFISVAIFAAFVALNAIRLVPPNKKQAGPRMPFVQSFRLVLATKEARPFLVIQGMTFAVLMIFLSNSSGIYIEHFGHSEEFLAIAFIANTSGNILMNRLNAYLLNSYRPEQLLKGFTAMQVAGGAVFLMGQLFFPGQFWLIFIGFLLAMSAAGGIIGNTNACFMSFFGKNAGAAAAIFGANMTITGSIIGAISAVILGVGILPVAVLMLVVNLVGFSSAVRLHSRSGSQPVEEATAAS
ncbi:multidrug effflux MFS transporter [Reinekea marinisedimentorum]|uniref:DHA1 family bicyclomycin/chloramphenicol resistance-like MFS transporter n=1 Tax=Reinekea marinisedimentorum TaxID=230495 RepID=A0A4V2UIH2_9GAMM|nr:multidrug effflux MFS transporter [Reinekea marinisedimentorum]TCS36130.1 DHA1 family bicyclomycin/chloramphenicol resistance-like MFS transporter [Reinekea marinisedimentorum]